MLSFTLWEYLVLVLQLAARTATEHSKLPVTQRNWPCALYLEAAFALSVMARYNLQSKSLPCISSGNHWHKRHLTDTSPPSSKTMTTKAAESERLLWKTGNVCCIYLGIFYCSSNILHTCTFRGFYNHTEAMHLRKEVLQHHFCFIYFALTHSSW